MPYRGFEEPAVAGAVGAEQAGGVLDGAQQDARGAVVQGVGAVDVGQPPAQSVPGQVEGPVRG